MQIDQGQNLMSEPGLRFYSPRLGRWTRRDLIGENGGVLLFGFTYNAPLSYWDPIGLDACQATLWIGHNYAINSALRGHEHDTLSFDVGFTCGTLGSGAAETRALLDNPGELLNDAEYRDFWDLWKGRLHNPDADRIRRKIQARLPNFDFQASHITPRRIIDVYVMQLQLDVAMKAREFSRNPCCSQECPSGIEVRARLVSGSGIVLDASQERALRRWNVTYPCQ